MVAHVGSTLAVLWPCRLKVLFVRADPLAVAIADAAIGVAVCCSSHARTLWFNEGASEAESLDARVVRVERQNKVK